MGEVCPTPATGVLKLFRFVQVNLDVEEEGVRLVSAVAEDCRDATEGSLLVPSVL